MLPIVVNFPQQLQIVTKVLYLELSDEILTLFVVLITLLSHISIISQASFQSLLEIASCLLGEGKLLPQKIVLGLELFDYVEDLLIFQSTLDVQSRALYQSHQNCLHLAVHGHDLGNELRSLAAVHEHVEQQYH